MAKKKQAVQELSLFDNSFFDDTPLSEEEILRTGYLDDIRQPIELSERKQAFHTMLDKMEEELKSFDSESTEKVTIVIPKNTTDEETADTRQRAKKKRIKVTFVDGTELCDANATTTMIQAIEKIGVERVAALGMKVCHIPLVAQEVNQRYIYLQGENPLQTYVMTINFIGLERIKKTNIKIGSSPFTTQHKKYNGQVKLDSGEWLTAPVTVKDKYKILRVISSLTHEPFEVKIIE